MKANKINHFYVIHSDYIAIALKQPDTVYLLPSTFSPHLIRTVYLHSRKTEVRKESSTVEKKKRIKLKIPHLCNIFYSLKSLFREKKKTKNLTKHKKTHQKHLFSAFKKDFLISNFVIISTLLSETLGH